MSREALLVRTLVELADNLVEDFDVIDLLTVLSDRCVEAFEVDSAGVMLAAAGGELQVVASSSDAMRVLELFELQANEGPWSTASTLGSLSSMSSSRAWTRAGRCSPRGRSTAVFTRPMRSPCTCGARLLGR